MFDKNVNYFEDMRQHNKLVLKMDNLQDLIKERIKCSVLIEKDKFNYDITIMIRLTNLNFNILKTYNIDEFLFLGNETIYCHIDNIIQEYISNLVYMGVWYET
jgi:hypothetical protein